MLDKTNLSLSLASLDRFGERNARIMRAREAQYHAHHCLVVDINLAWFERMWDTPDVAVCLGRFDRD